MRRITLRLSLLAVLLFPIACSGESLLGLEEGRAGGAALADGSGTDPSSNN